jgi:hypothetical protein
MKKAAGSIFNFVFTAFGTDGAAANFDAAPSVAVCEDATATEITAGASVAKFGDRAGLYVVTVDTDNAGYSDGHDYSVILTAGAVGGVSLAGSVVGVFELGSDIDLGSVPESLAAIQAQTDQLVIVDGKVAASADVDIDASALASAIAEAVVDELGGGENAVEYSDTIVSTSGDPIEGALIQLFSNPDQTPESRVTSTRTVELGAFVIYAPAGTYTMRVSHPEIESYVTEVTLS